MFHPLTPVSFPAPCKDCSGGSQIRLHQNSTYHFPFRLQWKSKGYYCSLYIPDYPRKRCTKEKVPILLFLNIRNSVTHISSAFNACQVFDILFFESLAGIKKTPGKAEIPWKWVFPACRQPLMYIRLNWAISTAYDLVMGLCSLFHLNHSVVMPNSFNCQMLSYLHGAYTSIRSYLQPVIFRIIITPHRSPVILCDPIFVLIASD